MLPVSWQMGCDLCLASAMFWSMIFSALSAMVPFFSCSSESRMAWLHVVGNFRRGAADQFEQGILQFAHKICVSVSVAWESVNRRHSCRSRGNDVSCFGDTIRDSSRRLPTFDGASIKSIRR